LEKQRDLEAHLMLVFTGLSRIASEVASEQIRLTPQRETELSLIRSFVPEGIKILTSKTNLSEFGWLLGEAWKVKRSLTTKVTNREIDDIYDASLAAGAVGGKLLGAGGGGFVLLFAKPEFHQQIRERLKGLLVVPFHFDHEGSKVLFSDDS
jgi:D-glycero-alpha-D-manno-heptose-7-phosphate kinase